MGDDDDDDDDAGNVDKVTRKFHVICVNQSTHVNTAMICRQLTHRCTREQEHENEFCLFLNHF